MSDGKHRHPATIRIGSTVALVIALTAAGFMLLGKPPAQSATPKPVSNDLTLDQAYPGKTPVTLKAKVTPVFFMDEKRLLGTATAADGATRLILITPAGERELRRLPKAQTPEFAGFAVQGQGSQAGVVWMELTNAADGRAETKVWTIDSETAAPRMITSDTGDVALFDKRDDVVVHDGQVSWLSAARTDTPQTEVRTVPLAGGKVRVDTREGAWSLAGWPWLTTVNLGQDGPVELRNIESQERIVVGVQANELMACSPKWCRSVIIGSTAASTVIELLTPDGKLRIRTATGNVAASTVDVAVLDRYEIYSYGGAKLAIYDLVDRRMIVVAKNISQVASRGPMLWWSTGDNETVQWHALDLRTLAKS